MVDRIGELMIKNPIALPAVASAADTARAMRDNNVGTVLVTNGGQLCGIVTDWDLVVRSLALSQTQVRRGVRWRRRTCRGLRGDPAKSFSC